MLKDKKIAAIFICVGIAAIISALIVSAVFREPASQSYRTDVPRSLDKAVAESIFTRESVSLSDVTVGGKKYQYAAIGDSDRFFASECMGEGHVILGYAEKKGVVEVYALCSYTGYGFVNGILIDNSGASCIPTLLTFEKTADGKYILKEAREAMDGGEMIKSVREMFPADLVEKAVSAPSDEKTVDSMQKQCEAYAKAYLQFLGRKARISTLADEEFLLLSDLDVSADVENELYGLHPEYGLYVGNFENIENGVRYVYSKEWKKSAKSGVGTVTLTKTEYDSGKVVEKFTYKVNGNKFSLVKPKKTKK